MLNKINIIGSKEIIFTLFYLIILKYFNNNSQLHLINNSTTKMSILFFNRFSN